MKKSEPKISLENFNPNKKSDPFLTSPRSLEACRKQGIYPHELMTRTPEEIKKMFSQENLDDEGYDLMWRHHEERRQEKVRTLIAERNKIIENENRGIDYKSFNFFSQKQKDSYHYPSETMATDQKLLNAVKAKTAKEIQAMIQKEAKLVELRERQNLEQLKQEERQRQKALELETKQQASEQKRLELEHKKIIGFHKYVERQDEMRMALAIRDEQLQRFKEEKKYNRYVKASANEEWRLRKKAQKWAKTMVDFNKQLEQGDDLHTDMYIKERLREEFLREQLETKVNKLDKIATRKGQSGYQSAAVFPGRYSKAFLQEQSKPKSAVMSKAVSVQDEEARNKEADEFIPTADEERAWNEYQEYQRQEEKKREKMDRKKAVENNREVKRQMEQTKKALLEKTIREKEEKANAVIKEREEAKHRLNNPNSKPRTQAGEPNKDSKNEIEKLKLKQELEMLQALDEEQSKENMRDKKLKDSKTEDERKKLEKVYDDERNSAYFKIQNMIKTHDENMKSLLEKLNV